MKRLAEAACLAGLAVAFAAACGEHAPWNAGNPISQASATAQYAESVAPVLEKRCAVCHGCYDSPCQLDLSSFQGLERGASKKPVYDSTRLFHAAPTRLFVDERSEEGWRKRGFTSVVDGGAARALLPRMLELARAHPLAAGERLPESLPLDISRELTCPIAGEFDAYAREHPLGGMPYGTAPLSAAELEAITSWLNAGAPAPPPPAPLPDDVVAEVASWEGFLNGESLEQQITARYLYEHWFLSHLYFPSHPAGPFFRVVRSRTPSGVAADEIASVRPYDAPGVERVWYRLLPIEGALLHKTHITYELGPDKMKRLQALFLAGNWKATRLPGYGLEASNPFRVFVEIPARARYQFLLDGSRNFVMNFIRGPVCYGQVAVDVIEDRFFVAFLDPDHDVSVVDPAFLPGVIDWLDLPAEHESRWAPGELFYSYSRNQTKYLDARAKAVAASDPKLRGPALDWIWNGAGRNPNALLTVYRHFDNAAVTRGFTGRWPKTAWIMDYPIFERIYYDLVAGFNVFGNVTHQVATRLYMDHLRMQSEDLFLTFLPPAQREPLRASWYVGATKQVDYFLVDRLRSEKRGTQVRYTTQDPKAELLAKILARAGAAAGPPDRLNRCAGNGCNSPAVERALRRLVGVRGPWVVTLPSLSLLRVQGVGVYSLIHDEAHTNVAFMFGEDSRRVPEDDEVTLAHGISGSYPNFIFEIIPSEAGGFVDALIGIRSGADLDRVVSRYGV
ncbi:MAG TPA: fatty acid cis/trans isomerase, partial [Myxococcota bacterium]|nr:fatty acid cis/trans isomerase [Myxococcota bacterium]